jgi:arginine/lysine/ornithine decarboxylase
VVLKTWNADTVKSKAGKKVRFEEASADWLATDPECWVLHPGEAWHGFGDLEDGYCMLDPIKVSVLTPGVGREGRPREARHPATLVTAYLHYRGVEVEKTTDFTILFLFSIASRKANGARSSTPCSTSSATTTRTPSSRRCCRVSWRTSGHLRKLGLRELADQMFAQLRDSRQTHWLAEAFSTLPKLS